MFVKKDLIKMKKNLEYYRSAGIALAGSCVPYLTGWVPLMGEHFVTSESHVILMCNSIWGGLVAILTV